MSHQKTTPRCIALFGATGPTGSEIVKLALSRGHTLRALVRTPSKLEVVDARLQVIQGDVLDAKAVESVMRGSDCAIVTLGGKVRERQRALEVGTRHVIAAMKTQQTKRLVVVTSVGVGDSKGQAGFFFERIAVPLFLRGEMADKNAQEEAVRSSGLDFVIARPGQLVNDSAKGVYEAAVRLSKKSAPKITRADVAHFCIEQLDNNAWLGQAVCLSN